MGQGFPSQRLGVNISAGTGLAQTGTVVLSNSNGITFGMQLSASSLVITGSVGGGAAISAGTTQMTAGTAVFSNSNGISFGLNGSTLTAQYALSAGTTLAIGSDASGIVLSNSNGLSFGANGATVTARMPTVRWFAARDDLIGLNLMQPSTTAINMSLQRFSMPFALSATQLDILRHLTVVGSTVGSYTLSYCIYTFAGSTASSVSSATLNVQWNSGTSTSAANTNYGGQSGTRWRSVTFNTWNFTPGEYLFGLMGSFNGVAGTTGSITIFGQSAISVNPAIQQTGNYSQYWNDGVFSVGASTFPASIHLSDVIQTGASALGQPFFKLIGSG